MRFDLYNNIKEFYKAAFNILMQNEAQNLVPLGNLIIGNEGTDKTGWRDPVNWFMATVSENDKVLLAAIMTPPHNLTLYAADNRYCKEILVCLVDGIIKNGIAVPGVMTEKSLAEDFSKVYTSKKGVGFEVVKRQRVYQLQEVNPKIPLKGKLRAADEADLSFFPYWFESFQSDCFNSQPSVSTDISRYRYHISTGKLFILEVEGTPVSMAKVVREMQTVSGVALVYTPPYFRGKGYATSCVAEVSRKILQNGFTKCALYTDLSNPTSNSIYQKIGYKPICDSLEIRFSDCV